MGHLLSSVVKWAYMLCAGSVLVKYQRRENLMEYMSGEMVRCAFGSANPNHAAAAICALFHSAGDAAADGGGPDGSRASRFARCSR